MKMRDSYFVAKAGYNQKSNFTKVFEDFSDSSCYIIGFVCPKSGFVTELACPIVSRPAQKHPVPAPKPMYLPRKPV